MVVLQLLLREYIVSLLKILWCRVSNLHDGGGIRLVAQRKWAVCVGTCAVAQNPKMGGRSHT